MKILIIYFLTILTLGDLANASHGGIADLDLHQGKITIVPFFEKYEKPIIRNGYIVQESNVGWGLRIGGGKKRKKSSKNRRNMTTTEMKSNLKDSYLYMGGTPHNLRYQLVQLTCESGFPIGLSSNAIIYNMGRKLDIKTMDFNLLGGNGMAPSVIWGSQTNFHIGQKSSPNNYDYSPVVVPNKAETMIRRIALFHPWMLLPLLKKDPNFLNEWNYSKYASFCTDEYRRSVRSFKNVQNLMYPKLKDGYYSFNHLGNLIKVNIDMESFETKLKEDALDNRYINSFNELLDLIIDDIEEEVGINLAY